MLFEGRPELVLPLAPETRQLRFLRWVVLVIVSASTFLAAGLIGLAAIYGQPYLSLLATFALPAFITLAAFDFYFRRRRAVDEAYWNPARIRERFPCLWQLYCAGNGTPVRPLRRESGAVQ